MKSDYERALELDLELSKRGSSHLISVRYLGPTNYRGSRVKLTSERFGDSVTLSYDYEIGSTYRQAALWLEDNGFRPVAQAYEVRGGYAIACSTFKGLKSTETEG